MFLDMESRDPWIRTVCLLGLISFQKESMSPEAATSSKNGSCSAGRTRSAARRTSAEVRVVERLSQCTAAVSWHDATSCNYESQIWRAGIARAKGRCALTGKTIRRDDAIYRPIGQPANAGAMIQSAALQVALDAMTV